MYTKISVMYTKNLFCVQCTHYQNLLCTFYFGTHLYTNVYDLALLLQYQDYNKNKLITNQKQKVILIK